jgi:UDP-N-acetylmuramoyl-tripeptide--D-alanyl-D-alanine ligase
MHLIYPASIAAGVGDLLGMTSEEIRAGIEDFTGQRMACEKYGDILLFDDTYNASPDSMKSSLQVLACLPTQKKAAVLGDMLEQGDFAQQLHREVGAAAAQAGLDTLITVGALSEDMADEAKLRGLLDVRSFPDRESAAKAVEEITEPGTALLFKASHSMALDKLAAISRKKAESLMR